jgi:hypothetical protein
MMLVYLYLYFAIYIPSGYFALATDAAALCATPIRSREQKSRSLREVCVRHVGPTGSYVTAETAPIAIFLSPFRTGIRGGWMGGLSDEITRWASIRSDALRVTFFYRKTSATRRDQSTIVIYIKCVMCI